MDEQTEYNHETALKAARERATAARKAAGLPDGDNILYSLTTANAGKDLVMVQSTDVGDGNGDPVYLGPFYRGRGRWTYREVKRTRNTKANSAAWDFEIGTLNGCER